VVGLRVVTTKLPDDLYQALVERATREGVSVSKLVRIAIQSYLGLPPQTPKYDIESKCAELGKKLVELERRISIMELAVFKLQHEREVVQQGAMGER
jgi:metal-responsive CopG/Arc/MetJ family transcriptional regulator